MLDLAIAEARRATVLTVRYPVELVLGLGLMGMLFYGIVLGARMLGTDATPAAIQSLATGYAVWMLAVGPIVGVAGDIQSEAAGGTLENLFLSRHSLLTLLLTRAVVSFAHSCLFVAVLVATIAAIGGIEIHLPAQLLLAAALLFISACGVGLALGGLALLLKRVHFVIVAVYALLFPLAFAPAGPGSALLPLAQLAQGMRASLSTGAVMDAATLATAATGACLWLAAGATVFAQMKARAERLGTISER